MDVSVLIPCFNRAQHIKQVVQHITEQTFSASEIIVVDDASTDDSVSILRKLPVHLINHEYNQGPAAARNTALEAAKGDIVLYIDADAYAVSDLIEGLVKTYGHYASCQYLAGVGGQGIEMNVQSLYDRWRLVHAPQTYGDHQRKNVPFLYGLCCSYKREVLRSVGGWDTYFRINAGEDADLGYRLRKAGYTLHYSPAAKVFHQHSDNYASLRRVQYNWYYWSFIAKKRNRMHPMTLAFGTFRRMLFDTANDILIHHDAKLAKLNVEICLIKLKGLSNAWRYCRKSGI